MARRPSLLAFFNNASLFRMFFIAEQTSPKTFYQTLCSTIHVEHARKRDSCQWGEEEKQGASSEIGYFLAR